MSLVSGRFLNDFLRTIARWQIDVEALLGDLPVPWNGNERKHPLVDWDIFVELMRRIERRVGGADGLQELGELIAGMYPARTLRRLAGLSASPTLLYRAGQGWALTRALPGLETHLEVLPDRTLEISCHIPERDRACPQIFHLGLGAARAFPRILDLPDAVVSAEISAREAQYRILLPPSGTLWARARRVFRSLFSARSALHQLEVQQLELRSHFDELHLAYAELEESHARHRALAESVADVIVELSPEGRVQFVSPSIEDLCGYRADQVIGSNFSLWLRREDCKDARELLAGIVDREGVAAPNPVFPIRHQRGEWIWAEATLRTFRSRTGDAQVVAVLRDVTHRVQEYDRLTREREDLERETSRRADQLERRNRQLRELQTRLLEAERDRVMRELASRISESLASPLESLAEQLRRFGGRQVSAIEIERAHRLAERMADVLRRTISLSGVRKAELGSVSARQVAQELQSALEGRAQRRRIELECAVDSALTDFDADWPLLQSALLSLAEGALDSLCEGGRLGIVFELLPASERVHIEIWDTGPGFWQDRTGDFSDSIFDVGLQASDSMGFGLSVARSVVRAHEGRIRIGRRPDAGNAVHIEIPRRAAITDRALASAD